MKLHNNRFKIRYARSDFIFRTNNDKLFAVLFSDLRQTPGSLNRIASFADTLRTKEDHSRFYAFNSQVTVKCQY